MFIINYDVHFVYFQGFGGWSSRKNVASSWVNLFLKDINDNEPFFHRQDQQISILEDTPPGSVLLTMSAEDHDGVSKVFIYIL